MALYSELPIYRDSYNLLLAIFQATSKFSHEYKYSLGQDMKRDALCLFRNLYRANKAKDKVESLEDFMADFELLKLEIRMCVDLKLLPLKKMAEISLLTDAIGRQVTSWRNKPRLTRRRFFRFSFVRFFFRCFPEYFLFRLCFDIYFFSGIPAFTFLVIFRYFLFSVTFRLDRNV